jgi:triacylglycerol lipase
MKYTYPNGFDLARAQELGRLVGQAYDQLTKGTAWQPPAGYTLAASLTAKEVWKVPSPFSDLLLHLLTPVPFGFVATKGNDVYVVLRGTQTPLEWLDDFTAMPMAFQPSGKAWGNITRGFKMLYDELGPQINQALAAVRAGGAALSVFVTGHSLGAALAHVAAAGISAQFGVQATSYTFSGPRAGDAQFAAACEAAQLRTWRIFNTEDIVPTVPPAAVVLTDPNMGMHGFSAFTQALTAFVKLSPAGYQHVGYPIAATFHHDTVADNHSLTDLAAEIAKP